MITTHSRIIPEVLSPAGDLEKMKLAFAYGADAVYLGGEKFGLRTRATNFDEQGLINAIKYAHKIQKKLYITINTFPIQSDMDELETYLNFLCSQDSSSMPDALIMSDLGAIKLAQKCIKKHGLEAKLPIHLSTQANTQSVQGVRFWADLGIKRVILARECPLSLVKEIKKAIDIEIEMFVHGSWCSAYSGHCTISNYTAARDSNRGGCAHSCRFNYQSPEIKNSTFLSSKDLMALELLPEFIDAGVDSLKIEGRMKTAMYVALTTSIYKKALLAQNYHEWSSDLEQICARGSTTGMLTPSKTPDAFISESHNGAHQHYLGLIIDKIENYFIVEVKRKFNTQTKLECITPGFPNTPKIKFMADTILSLSDQILEFTKPSTLVKIPITQNNQILSKWSIMWEQA